MALCSLDPGGGIFQRCEGLADHSEHHDRDGNEQDDKRPSDMLKHFLDRADHRRACIEMCEGDTVEEGDRRQQQNGARHTNQAQTAFEAP